MQNYYYYGTEFFSDTNYPNLWHPFNFQNGLYVTAGFINRKVFLYHVIGHKLYRDLSLMCRTTNTMGINYGISDTN